MIKYLLQKYHEIEHPYPIVILNNDCVPTATLEQWRGRRNEVNEIYKFKDIVYSLTTEITKTSVVKNKRLKIFIEVNSLK